MIRPLRVFICYASEDKPTVRKIYKRLATEKWIEPWLDEESLLAGQNFEVEIHKATRDADSIIVCLSKVSVAKEGYVNKEIRRALDLAQEKPESANYLIPLRLDDCNPSFEQLKKLHRLDYFKPNAHEKLLKSLRARAVALKIEASESKFRISIEENFFRSPDVNRAVETTLPIVALESTVITHGLPRPQNLELARDMERAVREEGATPATVAFLDGQLHIGLNDAELQRLANEDNVLKVDLRDFATVMVSGGNGGTTVAGTMLACKHANIKVFATGGIGGVHREKQYDISADLQALATIPMIVVCAGAKAILDLPATLEYLETMGVPVVGYGTDEFPAFYSRESGLNVGVRFDSPQEIIDFAKAYWRNAGLQSAVLVANPIPIADAISSSEMEPIIEKASKEAQEKGIHGQELTPFLLGRISELIEGKSLRANLSLLLNNARLAAQIARAWSSSERRKAA